MLKQSKIKKESNGEFWIADFETITKQSNYYKNTQHGRILAGEAQPLGDYTSSRVGTDMTSFERFLLSRTEPTFLFFHNLAKFDAYVIINYALDNWNNTLQKNGSKIEGTYQKTNHGILSITIKTPKTTIFIQDSLRILAKSVAGLGSDLGFPKGETNYHIDPVKHFSQLPKDFRDYLHRDVEIVNRSLVLFKTQIDKLNTMYNQEGNGASLTNSSLARSMIKHFDKNKSFEITITSQNKAHNYYRGGYTSFNQNLRNKKLQGDYIMYDAKSHYPSIMYLNDLPHKSPDEVNPEIFKEQYLKNEIPEEYSVIMVTVVGILKRNKNSGATIVDPEALETYWFENGEQDKPFEFRGTLREGNIQKEFYEFTSGDFKEVLVGYETTSCLKDFIKELYRLKETESNSLCYKIILNSMYGSSGMKHTYPTLFFELRGEEVPLEYREKSKEYVFLQAKNENFFNKYSAYDYVELKDESELCGNKWIAAFITSIGRAILMEHIAKDPEKMLYCDTDSMIGLVDSKSFQSIPKGKNLGDGDIDKKDIFRVFVQGAKRYILYRDENTPIKIGFAGVKKDVFFENFERDVQVATQDMIEQGQRRVVRDDKFFPYIEDNDYLNRKVIDGKRTKD